MREKSFYDNQIKTDDKGDNINSLWLLLKPYIKPFSKPLLIASFMLAVAAGMVIGFGKFLNFVVDHSLFVKGSNHFSLVLLGLVAAVTILALASYARTYYISWIGEQLIARLRYDLFDHILKFPITFFEDYQPANLVTRLTSDMTLLQLVLTNSLGIFVRNTLIIIGGIGMMLYTSPKLFGICCVILPALLLPVIYFGKIVRNYGREAQNLLANLAQFIDETLNHIKTVFLFAHAPQDRASFHGYNTQFVQSVLKAAKARAKLVGFAMVLLFSGLCTVAYIGAEMVYENILSKGDLLAFLFYALTVCGSLGSFSSLFADFYRAAGASDRIAGIMQTPPPPIITEKKRLIKQTGILAIHGVSFTYPSQPQHKVLDNISFSVLPGETLAIVGPSGAGKSTIFSLLLKFYNPSHGNIYLDGANYQDLSDEQVRSQLGLVTQDPVIFSSTIFENVAYGVNTAQESKIWEALEMVHLREFVLSLPYGLQTMVGYRGIRLSGGQKQRLALARVLLLKPRFLLLDEATNSLDAESDSIVQKNLKSLQQECTTLVIAHRLSTVIEANKIIVLNQGKIEQSGNHSELMQQEGIYKNFAKLEFAGYSDKIAINA
jgi:ATP-binding cassette subfamily B protein